MFQYFNERNPRSKVLLRRISKKIDLILENQETLMSTMAELQTAVARNTDVEDSVLTLLRGISQQLKDARAANDPAAFSAVIKNIDDSTAKLSAAVVENTPEA